MLLNNKARIISFSGIILALNLIIMMSINFIPTNKVSILALASIFPSIILVEFGYKISITYNIAQILLGFFLINNKFVYIGYLLSFAIYGILKSIIETKIKYFIVEYLLKISYSTLSFISIYFFTNLFFKLNPIFLFYICYVIIFLIYDYVYSMTINYYTKNLRNRIKFLNKNK